MNRPTYLAKKSVNLGISRTPFGLLATTMLPLIGCSGSPEEFEPSAQRQSVEAEQNVFHEPFTWRGNHASTLDHGGKKGSTVWWREGLWDIHGDTGYLATSMPKFGDQQVIGYHIDVHRALNDDPTDGEEANGLLVVGGDGSPGVAAMRLDYQGISSARLRNPMLVSEGVPGVVEFYAPLFVTTGHWWEIAVTPASTVTGAENTAVPQQVGRAPFEDSLNFVAISPSDIPCSTGWDVSLEVHRSRGGQEDLEMLDRGKMPVANPNEKMKLTHWRLEYRPSGVDLFGDVDEDGTPEHIHHYSIGVPWPEVHVHLLGVAYQADHHPQDSCYQGISRELVWREVSVSPVKYDRTSIAPRNGLTENIQRKTGWMDYDTRDIQRVGPPVNGAPQANEKRYEPYANAAFNSFSLPGAKKPVSSKELGVDLDPDQADAALARLVYDIKGTGTATLTVNGKKVGTLPADRSLRWFQANPDGTFEWAHRSLDIAPSLFVEGYNVIRVDMTGNVAMDRLHLEFSHASAASSGSNSTGTGGSGNGSAGSSSGAGGASNSTGGSASSGTGGIDAETLPGTGGYSRPRRWWRTQ